MHIPNNKTTTKNMNIKQKTWHAACMTVCLSIAPALANGQTFDFEDCEIGQKFTMWNVDQGNITDEAKAVAEVVADPTNPNNKVLHITVKTWGTFVTLTLPPELAGHMLTDSKSTLSFDLYRPTTDADDWKQFHAYLGNDKLYQDESYPYQGDKGQWIEKQYPLGKVTTATDDERNLHIGIHHNNSEYYIDNVRLKGQHDDYFVASNSNNLIDICKENTSSDYMVWNTPTLIPENETLNIRTARYSYLNSKMEGAGIINLYAGGERTYLGSNEKNNKNYHPDWSLFNGTLNIFPYKDVEANAGFYGLVWMSGKTFAPDNAAQNAADGNINPCFANTKVVLHNGATIACESGKRGLRIAHLDTEEGSTIYGYLKEKVNNDAYYMVGGDNSDGTLAGRIIPMGGSNLNIKVGLVKEGKGTYRITGNQNLITGGIRIIDGAVMANNDVQKAETGKLSGAIGQQTSAQTPGVYVMSKGLLGGVGSIGSTVDLYGTLAPGDGGIGTLMLKNFATKEKPNLVLHPKSKIRMEVTDGEHYDQLVVDGNISISNKMEDFSESNEKPRMYITLTSNPTLAVGDELKLITCNSKDEALDFDVRYPKQYTWKTDIKEIDGKFAIVACVTSLEYGGQGEWKEDSDEETKTDTTTIDIEKEKTYSDPLRTYTEKQGKYIGTCVSLYDNKINIDDENDSKTRQLIDQFNMVVCENEMKFDTTEPNQGEFNYYNGDRLVAFAQKHNMRVRGHALVWYSQVAQWLSKDGKKNDKNFTKQQLLDIMKNHIYNVAGHYKGKVAEWDVCNEVLDDDQSIVRTDPNGFKLRAASIWNFAGDDYIEKAFRWAHEAAPDAQLILNDYGVEFQGQAKAEAFYNLAKYLKEKGVPIDGVGLQCHLDVGNVDINKLKATIDRFNAIGLRCVITELDLGMDDNEANRMQQAKDYYNIARIAMEADNCNELMIWGLTDAMTWRGGRNPLLYDSDLTPKPAYYGLHQGLRETSSAPTAISPLPYGKPSATHVVAETYYNLQGQRITSSAADSIYITSQLMSDGSVRNKKVINR